MKFFGGLDTVWMVVMFDLPTETAENRKRYTRFRKMLLNDGFTMLQLSIYGRHCASGENADVHENRVVAGLPDGGDVRILRVTEKQFAAMKIFMEKSRRKQKNRPFNSVFSEKQERLIVCFQPLQPM